MTQEKGDMSRILLVGWLLAAATVQSGCAAAAAETARQSSLKATVEQLEYRQPCDTVFPLVQQVLTEKQFVLNAKGPFAFETNPVIRPGSVDQYSGQATPTPAGGCRVGLTLSHTLGAGTPTVKRDWELELAVLKRVDPQLAEKIQADGAAAADQARQRYEAMRFTKLRY